MIVVDRLLAKPHHCAVFPHMTEHSNSGQSFFDFGQLAGNDPRVYISHAAAEEMARHMDWASPAEAEEQAGRIHELELRIGELEDENNQANGYLDAIDLLESKGFRERKKPGRPKNPEPKAA